MNKSKSTLNPPNYLALIPLLQKGSVCESNDVAIAHKRARNSYKKNLKQTNWLDELIGLMQISCNKTTKV